jgi:hypothetical protein
LASFMLTNCEYKYWYKCCDVAVTQINHLSLNKQDSIEQVRGRSHKEGLVQIFMLYDMQLGWDWGYLGYSRIKQPR